MTTYQWAIIGAGPSGIAVVGKLLDAGIPPEEILWVDPNFTVGDFGTLWRNVPSNTKVELFLKFLHAVNAFNYKQCPIDFPLNHAAKNKTCHLNLMAEPLQWVTNHLITKVHIAKDIAEKLTMKNGVWNIQLTHSTPAARNVVLATGADAKSLAYHTPMIPLDVAMDADKIKTHIDANDTVAVFGSSHSAMLALRNLVESSAKQIINFYRQPLRYAVYMDDWILFDDTGLKGTTAEWARHYIDGEWPSNLMRVTSNEANIKQYLPLCNKAIYAVGFERKAFPVLADFDEVKYIEQAGIIAPGLFGFGIAFPEAKINPLGVLEHRVGLWKFMDYLTRVLPLWMKYSIPESTYVS
jgi:cation diffusion facilitator CzcD-associated flavoprotein CzcO